MAEQGLPSLAELLPEEPNDDFPRVPRDLLEALEERFPDKCPDLRITDREVWAATGRAEVVRFLREMHQRLPLHRKH